MGRFGSLCNLHCCQTFTQEIDRRLGLVKQPRVRCGENLFQGGYSVSPTRGSIRQNDRLSRQLTTANNPVQSILQHTRNTVRILRRRKKIAADSRSASLTMVPSQKRNYRKRPFLLPSALQASASRRLLAILFPKVATSSAVYGIFRTFGANFARLRM
jgi:hypothetical protein